MQGRKQQLELDMEQQTSSKYENEYVKAKSQTWLSDWTELNWRLDIVTLLI